MTNLADIARQIDAYKLRQIEAGDGDKPFNRQDFIENHLMITDVSGQKRSLILNRAQEVFYELYITEEKERGYVRILVLKIRQLGISTIVEAIFFTDVYTRPNISALIVAHRNDSTLWIFGMSRGYYQNLPEEMKASRSLATSRISKEYLKFAHPHNSSLTVGTAGAVNVGHGTTLQLFHGSEVARWPDPVNLMAGVGNACHDVPGTAKILETTGNGPGDYFNEMWDAAKRGENEYKALFLGLKAFPVYSLPMAKGEKLKMNDEEKDYQQKHKMPRELMKFVLKKKNGPDCGGSFAVFKQQFPVTEEEAFSHAGRPVFHPETLMWMLETHCKDPIASGDLQFDSQGRMSTVSIVKADRPLVEIWEYPDPSKNYIFTMDVAEGLGADYTVGQVWEVDTSNGDDAPMFCQVAKYVSNRVAVEKTALHAWQLGVYYHWCYLAAEANNHGIAVGLLWKNGSLVDPESKRVYPQTAGAGYPSIYYSWTAGKREDEETGRVGFLTTGQTKPLMFDNHTSAIMDKRIIFRSRRTIQEHMGYFYDAEKKKNIQRRRDPVTKMGHDDEIISCALVHRVYEGWRNQWLATPKVWSMGE